MTKRTSLAILLAACAAPAWSVPVEKWVQTTRADFEDGEAQGSAILALGQVVLAPELKPLLPQPVPHILALAADAQGTLHAAAGMEPKLLRVRGGKAETFFAPAGKPDVELLAVALGPDGALYTSAAPSGTLYRIAPDGKAQVLYAGEDPYLWALAIGPDGTVYAGTGPNGKLLKITPQGKASVLLDTEANHILSVLRTADGTLYAGTDKEGLLYAVSPQGASRIVYDAAQTDIRALALDPQGRLYFATASTRPTPSTTTTPARPAMPSPPTVTPRTVTTPSPKQSAPSAPGAKVNATNAIYRLAPDGDVSEVASLAGVAFYALAWHDGHLYAGTGNDGKLYRLDNGDLVQLADLEESQIMALAPAGGALCLATANPGQLYRVVAGHAAEGTFTSQVYDTDSLARWGQIAWQAHAPEGTSVALATRSGNVAKPGASWSPWSDAYDRSEGQRITSPNARFIQYRATLKTTKPSLTPILDEVVVAYVTANRPPEITQLRITKPPKPRRPTTPPPPGLLMQPQPPQPSRPLNTSKQPAESQRGPFADRIRILWQASDPNKDGLVYALHFRGEDETTWKKIRERLTLVYYDWDTHAVPDGPYRIRLVATDSQTNPPDQALSGQSITEAFLIDNTPPAVSNLGVRVAKDRVATVSARCTDAGSGVASAEYSIDGGNWVSVAPADGIFDSHAETLQFQTPALAAGEHTLVVRAKDEAENSGAAKSVFQVP